MGLEDDAVPRTTLFAGRHAPTEASFESQPFAAAHAKNEA